MTYVMVVDDDEDFATAAAMVLRDAGYEVSVELEPQHALESMELRPPDLAILDVMFPEDSRGGFKLARSMRHTSRTLKDIPILMLTAVNARFALGFGAQDIDDDWLPITEFLEKPIDLGQLESKAAALLAG